MPYPMTEGIPSWPRPGQPSTYLEMAPLEDDLGENTKWWRDRVRDRWVPVPSTKETFTCQESMAFYHARDRCMCLTKKKEPPGHVSFVKLPEVLKKVFRKSRDKEIKSRSVSKVPVDRCGMA